MAGVTVMSSHRNDEIGRVVVRFGAASEIKHAVNAAITLAAALDTEVFGVFVPDSIMDDIAGLPVVRTLSGPGAAPVQITPRAMREAIVLRANHMERQLLTSARAADVRCTFISAEDEFARTSTTENTDVLVIPGSRLEHAGVSAVNELRQVSDRARTLLSTAWCHRQREHGPVIAFDDGDRAGEASLVIAGRISRAIGMPVHLFAIASDEADCEAIQSRAVAILELDQIPSMSCFSPSDRDAMARKLWQLAPRFVVADLEGEPFSTREDAVELLRSARAPFLLVRANSDDSAAV